MTCSSQEVAGAIRQLIVEIDCRLIQNPAYGLLIFIKKNKQSVYTDCCFYFIWIFPLLMWYTLYKYKFGMVFDMKWEFAFLYLLQDMHTPVLDKIMLFFACVLCKTEKFAAIFYVS